MRRAASPATVVHAPMNTLSHCLCKCALLLLHVGAAAYVVPNAATSMMAISAAGINFVAGNLSSEVRHLGCVC